MDHWNFKSLVECRYVAALLLESPMKMNILQMRFTKKPLFYRSRLASVMHHNLCTKKVWYAQKVKWALNLDCSRLTCKSKTSSHSQLLHVLLMHIFWPSFSFCIFLGKYIYIISSMESLGGDLPKRSVFCLMFSSLLPNPLVSSFESEAHLNIEQVA